VAQVLEGEAFMTRTTNEDQAYSSLETITAEDAVDQYLTTNNLTEESVPLEAVLVQTKGTSGGRPAILLVATIDGQKRVIKTSARLFSASALGLDAVIEQRLGRYWKDA
jgi:hypothetical protein